MHGMERMNLLPGSAPRRRALRAGLWLALLAAAGPALAAVQYQVGTAHAASDGRVLYREHHWTWEGERAPRRLVLYRCPDGAAFARKHVDAGPGASTPDIDFTDGRDGYAQRITRAGAAVDVLVRESAGRERRLRLPARGDAVIDAGFDAYVRRHWAALDGQGARTVPFLVPDRSAWLDFRLRHLGDAGDDAGGERRLRLTLAAWYGFAVPAIDLTYQRGTRRLLRFEGIGYVRDRKGRHPRVRIEFPAPPRDTGDGTAAIAAAAAVPLTGRCPG
jgi:hypothetical protein